MKIMRKLRIMGLILLLLGGVSISSKTQAQPGVNISFQTFYEELSPYGRWVRTPQYGSVWVPDAPSGFQPYSTAGYWEVTEYGNTWVSEYDWGWAPFHYGRWSFDDYNGWFWIPGYEWGPAWVNWRSGGGYYGWAPLGPGMQVNISVNLPSFWWVFVPQRYITSPRWHSYCAPRNRVSHYYGRTTIINNYYYNNNRTYAYGPRRDEIERVTRRSVSVREIDMRNRGRVVVAGNSRGNDRYDNSRGYNDRSSRYNDANRRGSTIDAGSSDRSSRGNGRNPGYEANRSDNNSRSNREYEAPTRAERVPNRDVPDNGPERSSRSERGNEPVNPGGNRESYEVPATRPSRSERGSYEAPAQRESRQQSGSYEAPVQRESRSNRGSYEAPVQRESRSNRGSYEAPVQRESRSDRGSSERGSYESRGSAPDARSSQGSSERGSRGGGGASDRSSRGPR
ncbi:MULTISPECIES: DUF6600 domain-containing protein [Dyadobacter]|uniref:YXWGXW repeat-containing protein n=1 Tax=Dyadobacter chenhuakuii TaxID=2909339 RepID=A0ABY4XFH3_9BACT|nr:MULTISPECIES: DUF6600 domain-containing protein [Dyadobacter]MCE7069509.1 hypothetical protein [Dyadobacter sp. CY327]MCF2491830.1 hypothetical protein [Dyadobacter chenhuakuii]MCF2516466.1 hypothetical protein [Dyadobacter sp. CY351]USJ29006.1 hypothetical protein NFI80_14090 [Dyadobacter chenhuakuii]